MVQCWALKDHRDGGGMIPNLTEFLAREAREDNGSDKYVHNCDVRQNGMNVTRKIQSVRGTQGELEITHPGRFSQNKWHLSKSLKEG